MPLPEPEEVPEEEPVTDPAPAEEPAAEPTPGSGYHVGDTVENDGLSLTFVSSGDYVSDNEFLKPKAGEKIIKLSFHADNQSGSDRLVSMYDFSCYADGYECEAFYGEDGISATLSDGRTGEGSVYFQVPENAADIEVEYDFDWLEDNKVVFVYEGNKDSGMSFEKASSASSDAYHVGDVVETDSLRIIYKNAAEYTGYSSFIAPEPGNKVIYIELEAENISSSDQNISIYSFECYADGTHCEGFYGMDDELSASLSPKRKARGTVAFQVPESASIIEIEYSDNLWTQSKIIFAYPD